MEVSTVTSGQESPSVKQNHDTPPRQLSTDRRSPHYDPCFTNVSVYFNGVRRPDDVHEYNMDAGWIDVRKRNANGRFVITRDGTFILTRMHGKVEATWTRAKMPAFKADLGPVNHQAHIDAAAAKRARKAARLAKLADKA